MKKYFDFILWNLSFILFSCYQFVINSCLLVFCYVCDINCMSIFVVIFYVIICVIIYVALFYHHFLLFPENVKHLKDGQHVFIESHQIKEIIKRVGWLFPGPYLMFSDGNVSPFHVVSLNSFLHPGGLYRPKTRIFTVSLASSKKKMFFCPTVHFYINYT
jgi:hypothetical protein